MTVLVILCLLLRRLRRHKLFPYTTLFRSWVGNRERAGKGRGGGGAGRIGRDKDKTGQGRGEATARLCFYSLIWFASLRRDRKSTRLNSSHTVISYAVFCLKKKNQYEHSQQ